MFDLLPCAGLAVDEPVTMCGRGAVWRGLVARFASIRCTSSQFAASCLIALSSTNGTPAVTIASPRFALTHPVSLLVSSCTKSCYGCASCSYGDPSCSYAMQHGLAGTCCNGYECCTRCCSTCHSCSGSGKSKHCHSYSCNCRCCSFTANQACSVRRHSSSGSDVCMVGALSSMA